MLLQGEHFQLWNVLDAFFSRAWDPQRQALLHVHLMHLQDEHFRLWNVLDAFFSRAWDPQRQALLHAHLMLLQGKHFQLWNVLDAFLLSCVGSTTSGTASCAPDA